MLVGLSGGVDSTLAAQLLQEQGYQVIGVTLNMLPETSDQKTIERAQTVAAQLGIEHHIMDCSQRFSAEVLHRCWEQYRQGETPNPCVICNRYIKFGWMIEYATQLQCPWVATGHYARMEPFQGHTRLFRGTDHNKDQSYFLCAINNSQREKVIFPLGNMTKTEVRECAQKHGLASANDSDSQDICFNIHSPFYTHFFNQTFGALNNRGVFQNDSGGTVAPHLGTHHYTIGQRKGLGVALGKPAFVRDIDPISHVVHLTTQPESLLCESAMVRECQWHGSTPTDPVPCVVQTRYRQKPVQALVTPLPHHQAHIRFLEPLRAVSPGQWAVFYQNDLVLGGGILLRNTHASL